MNDFVEGVRDFLTQRRKDAKVRHRFCDCLADFAEFA